MNDETKAEDRRIFELCAALGRIRDMTGPNEVKDWWPIEVGRLLNDIHTKAKEAKADYCSD